MKSIAKVLENVHFSVHFLKAKKKYSTGLYMGKGITPKNWSKLSSEEKKASLKKYWYVRWSYRNPQTGKLERQTNIKAGANDYQTKNERLEVLEVLKKNLEHLLDLGYSPYKDNAIDFENKIEENNDTGLKYTVSKAFDYALKIKKAEVSDTTYGDYESRLNNFKDYLKDENIFIAEDITKKNVSAFLNKYKSKNSNNFKAAISSIFSVLSDANIIQTNFIKELRNKPVKKKASKKITDNDFEDAIDKLKKHDQMLLIYVRLISFMFWRPIEAVRIEIENIDLSKMLMVVNTKGKDGKTKIIPEFICEDIVKHIDKRQGHFFDLKASTYKLRRNYMTNRFRKFRVKHEIDENITPVRFRYYYITKLYLYFRKIEKLSEKKAITKLSLITGHESNAIWKYITINDIELPGDYSDLLKRITSS